MLLNDPEKGINVFHESLTKLGVIDANKIAFKETGLPILNTVIVGAFARMSGLLDIEPCCEPSQDYFSGERLSANIVCAKRGYEEVKLFDL